LSGAATGGLLAIRAGPKVAGKNALAGGVILAMIEGLNVAIQVKKRLPKLFHVLTLQQSSIASPRSNDGEAFPRE
jgi:hypothetical protein